MTFQFVLNGIFKIIFSIIFICYEVKFIIKFFTLKTKSYGTTCSSKRTIKIKALTINFLVYMDDSMEL